MTRKQLSTILSGVIFLATRIFLLALFTSISTSCKEPAEEEIPRLMKQLQSVDSHARNAAAQALASYGLSAKQAVKPLTRALHDENSGVQSSAAYALRKIDTPEARQALESYQKANK